MVMDADIRMGYKSTNDMEWHGMTLVYFFQGIVFAIFIFFGESLHLTGA